MLTRILAVATIILGALVIHQYRTIGELRDSVATTAAQAAADARTSVIETIRDRNPELQRTIVWLNDFYTSPDGLKRPTGLCEDGRPDSVGIGAWVFDVYLRRRLQGDSDDQARGAIATAIKQSDEWRRKHPS